jgi:hypothetical protein
MFQFLERCRRWGMMEWHGAKAKSGLFEIIILSLFVSTS